MAKKTIARPPHSGSAGTRLPETAIGRPMSQPMSLGQPLSRIPEEQVGREQCLGCGDWLVWDYRFSTLMFRRSRNSVFSPQERVADRSTSRRIWPRAEGLLRKISPPPSRTAGSVGHILLSSFIVHRSRVSTLRSVKPRSMKPTHDGIQSDGFSVQILSSRGVSSYVWETTRHIFCRTRAGLML